MANLPIAANNAPPAGGAANVLLPNNTVDTQAGDAQAGEPFAKLLALQMDTAELFALGGAQTAAAVTATTTDMTTDPALKDGGETANIADITNDPAAALAALLIQMPAQKSGSSEPKTEASPSSSAITGRQMPESKTALDARFGAGHLRIAENVARQMAVNSPKEDNSLGSQEANFSSLLQTASTPEPVPSDMPRRTELATTLLQPSSNAAQTANTSAVSAMMPNMLASNRPADAAQTVTTPLGSGGWADDFSQKISWMVTQQSQVAELHLNPPDLGPLNVVLKLSDNQATALFTSPHSAVRDAVESALPKLREMLADNGIMLGNTSVSDQSLPDRSAERFANRNPSTMQSLGALENDNLQPAAPVAPARRHNGMVDTFA
jgi:flagellar hook-length control protein FliK